jgi:7,8-dihydroneopterin aldolase/epimerase/oxygenase
LRFTTGHGRHKEEWKVGNEVEVDVSICFDAPEEAVLSIKDTIDYVLVYGLVKKEMNHGHLLLETCAQTIAGQLKEQFPYIKKINISIVKLNPAITNFTGKVGVIYKEEFN